MKITRFVIFLTFCIFLACKNDAKKELIQIKVKQKKINYQVLPNKGLDTVIKPYQEHINATLDRKLAEAKYDITKSDGELSSSLGNLMSDICFLQAQPIFNKRTEKNIDFVLLNHGGMRAAIPQGPITARNAFEVMPFENELVVVELSGKQVEALFSYLATDKKAHPVANLKLKIAREANTYHEVSIKNQAFNANKNYFVLTSDYLQQGGDNMDFFTQPLQLYKLDYKVRNALIDYFKNGDTFTPNREKRIDYAN